MLENLQCSPFFNEIMKKQVLMGLVAVCLPLLLSAQQGKLAANQFYGTVFIDETTVLEGIVELNGNENTPWDIQKRVRFFTEEQLAAGRVRRRDKQEFRPGDILGFQVGERIFLSRRYAAESLLRGAPEGDYLFLELLVDGPLQLFNFFDAPPPVRVGTSERLERSDEDYRSNPDILIGRPGERLRDIAFIDVADYIGDSEEVMERYHNGYYGIKPVNHEERRGLGRFVAQAIDKQARRELVMPLVLDYNASMESRR